MLREIYKEENFIIVIAGNGYIVVNENKDFDNGHTHLRSVSACKKVIHCARFRTLNGDMNNYMLTSIIRVSEDESYIRRLKELIRVKSRKGKKRKYYNHNSRKR